MAGVALDWKKVFDPIPVSSVRIVLERAGVPRWIAVPVCSVYSAARRLRVEGALGAPWRPASGFLL
eukprot:2599711-Lingulodinium_polyedra.AAC.1